MEKKYINIIAVIIIAVLLIFQGQTTVSAQEETGSGPEYADINLVAGSKDAEAKQEEEEVITQIEEGEAVLLMADEEELVARAATSRASTTVSLVKGEPLYYDSWTTHYFYINGNLGYCLEPSANSPNSGSYAATVLADNKLLSKALYYLVGGPGYTSALEKQFFPGSVGNQERNYCISHVVLSYIYDNCSASGDAFTGVSSATLQQVKDITAIIQGLEAAPDAELSISPSSQESSYVKSDGIQKTGSFKLTGDDKNYITITLPDDVTIHNQTTDKNGTGKVKISGGDKFYFTAPLTVTGTWKTGSIYGAITDQYKALVINEGDSTQTVGSWSYTIAGEVEPVSFSVKWLDMGQISLKKMSSDTSATADGVDDSYYSLKGATFEVRNSSGTVVDTLVTDEKGEATSVLLPYGNYKLVETKNPTGYLFAADASVELESISASVTVKEQPQYGQIGLKKVDSETGKSEPQGAASLEKASYQLHNSAGKLLETLTTDKEGKAVSDKYPLGTYTIKEVISSEGHLIDQKTYTVKIESADRVTPLFVKGVTSEEDIIRGDVQLVKFRESLDSEEEIKTPLEGIAFTFTSKTTGKVVRTITTDKNGYASTATKEHPRGGLVYDTYLVEEVADTVPEGVKVIEPFEVTISEEGVTHYFIIEDKNIMSPLTIVKKDSTTGNVIPVADTEFRLLDENKEVVTMTTYYPNKVVHETFKTDDNGQFTFPEKLAYGIYYLEEVQAPDGYLKGALLEIKIEKGHKWEEPFIVEYSDEPVMGKIVVHKTDSDTEGYIEGAEFTITAKEDIVTADGTIRLKAGDPAAVITSNKNGMAVTDKLFLGIYEVEETKIPAGYVKPATTKTVELKYENQEVALVREVVEVVNHPTKIILTKIKAGQPARTLSGVKFAFWNKADEENEALEKEILTTDEQGAIILQYLVPGTYCFQEVSSLPGFLLDDAVYEITIDENGYVDGERIGKLTVENDYTKVDISKQEIAGEQEIEGAEMELTDGEGNTIETWVSGKEPHRIEELAPGDYVLKENLVPTGYLAASEVPFTVKESGEVQSVIMHDEVPMGQVLLHKTDKANKKALAGVEYELLDADGKVLETLVTDESGKAVSQLYQIGTYEDGVFGEPLQYYLIESKALAGYAIDKTVYEVVFAYVDGNTPIIEVQFELTNELIPEEPDTKPEPETEPETEKEKPVEETKPGTTPTAATMTTSTEGKTASSVKTGDNTSIIVLLMALIASAAGIGIVLYKKKSKK